MILVTGATGLLGSHLMYDLVSNGFEVRAMYRSSSKIEKTRQIFSYYTDQVNDLMEKVSWVQADMMDVFRLNEIMEGVDEVYHCAGLVSFNKKDHAKMMSVNVNGTANILNVCIEQNVKKFCHVSSIASFGRPEGNTNVIDESVHREENENSSIYSLSKYYAELEVWRAIEEGLNAVIINPSTIIGSGSWETGSSALFPKVWKGLSYYTEGINGFVDVRDVVKVMKALMEKNIFKDQYILVSENLTFKEVITAIAKNLNIKEPSIRANKLISEFAWRMEELKCAVLDESPVITKESARIALDTQFYSNKKIKALLKLDFIPIQKSIRDVSNHFLNLGIPS